MNIYPAGIVSTLDRLVLASPGVKFGSYPYIENPDYKTILTVEGMDEASVDTAVSVLVVY